MNFRYAVFLILCFHLMTSGVNAQRKGKTEQPPPEQLAPDVTGTPMTTNERTSQQQFVDGCRYRMLGDTTKAMTQFNAVLKTNPENHAALYEIAGIYTDQKQYDKALSYLLPAIKIDGTNKWYRILAADIYEAQGKFADGAEQLKALSQQFPDDADYLYDYAYFLVRNEDYDKAIDAYNRIEKKAGVTEEISVAKKDIYLKLGKPDKAVEEITKLKKAYPDEPSYQAMLVDLYMENGMQDKAMGAIEDLANVDTNNAQAQLALAEYNLKNGNWEKAFDALKVVFADNRVDIDFKVKVLVGYFPMLPSSKARQQEAISLAQILTKTHPQEAKAWALNGDVLSQCNKNQEALDSYLQATKLDDSKFSVWQQVLFLESALDMKEQLLTTSQNVLELFPDQPLAHYYSGVAKVQLKQCEAAIKSFQNVLNMGSDDKDLLSQVYASIGDCQHTLQQYTAADSSYDMSLNFDPQNVYTLNNYSFYLAQRGVNLDKAEKMSFRVVNALAPGNPNYQDTYAWVLYKMKRYDESKTWIEKALATKPNDANMLEHYGDILFQLNNPDQAVSEWQKALTAGGDKEKLEKKIRDRQAYE